MFYNVIGIQPRVYGVKNREEIAINLAHIEELIDNSMSVAPRDAPAKLVVLPESALQEWSIDLDDMDHVQACKQVAIEVPGKETDALSKIARRHGVYIYAVVRATWPEVIKDRHFNTSILIDPDGNVVLKAVKTIVTAGETSCVPLDVWDAWTDHFGDDLRSLYPVVETEIGRIGTLICKERCFPETSRILAMHGAEVVIMSAYIEPLVQKDWLEIQTRARAIDNCIYAVAPNVGPYHNTLNSQAWNLCGGKSIIVDYMGAVKARLPHYDTGFLSATVNVQELREYRKATSFGGGIGYIPNDLWQSVYNRRIQPQNTYMKSPPAGRKEKLRAFRELNQRIQKELGANPQK